MKYPFISLRTAGLLVSASVIVLASPRPYPGQTQSRPEVGKPGRADIKLLGDDIYYCVMVTIGSDTVSDVDKTKRKELALAVDTGSADLWVYSTYMPDAQLKTIHYQGKDVFNPMKTKIDWHTDGGEKATHTFGPIGYVNGLKVGGLWGWDTVHLQEDAGEFNTKMGLTLKAMNLGVASDVTPLEQLSVSFNSGIIGLGFSRDPVKYPSVFQFAVQNDMLEEPVFTLNLPRPKEGINGGIHDGTLRFGYINDVDIEGGRGKLSKPAKILTPQRPEDHQEWQIKSGQKNRAVIDSDTQSIYLPEDLFQGVYDSMTALGLNPIIFDQSPSNPQNFMRMGVLCNKINVLDGKAITIPLGDTDEKASIRMEHLVTKFEVHGKPDYCELNLILPPQDHPAWTNVVMLGRPFFHSNTVVFKLNPNNINEGWIQWGRYRGQTPSSVSNVAINDPQVVLV